MSKYVYSQNNFARGELGAKAQGNILTEDYQNSCSLLHNFIPRSDGGVFKRPGTWYAGQFSQSKIPFLIPFMGSDGKKFIITIDNSGDKLTTNTPVGFYNVQDGSFVTAIAYSTSPNPYKAICASLNPHGFHYTQSGNVVIVTHESGEVEPIVIKYIGNDSGFAETFFWCYWSNAYNAGLLFNLGIGFRPLTTPYTDKNISAVTMTPNATNATQITASVNYFLPTMIGSYLRIGNSISEGIFYIQSIPTRQVATVNATSNIFTVLTAPLTGDEVVFHGTAYVPEPLQMGKVYYAINVSGTEFKVAYTAEEAVAGTAIDVKALPSGTLYYTPNAPSTIANGVSLILFPATTASDNWAISEWSDYRGWPKSVSFYENRLFFGGTKLRPSTIYASLINNIFFFMNQRLDQDSTSLNDENDGTAPTSPSGLPFTGYLKETDPFVLTISTTDNDHIKWLVSGKNLFVGTSHQEGSVTGGDSILSYLNFNIRFDTAIGCAPIQGIKINQSLLYVARNGKSIRDFVYYDTNGSYVSIDLSKINDDILANGYEYDTDDFTKSDLKVLQMCHDANRSCLWILTNTYNLIGVIYDRQFNIIAWHRHKLGGALNIKSMCIIPMQNYDRLYLATERVVNSVTYRMMEYLDIGHDEDYTFQGSMNYLDCALQGEVNASSEGTDTAGPFAFLLGVEDLGCVVQGLLHPDVDVVMGSAIPIVQLNDNYDPTSKCIIGYKYDSYIELNAIQAGGDFGPSIGTLHRTDRITVRFYKSIGFSYEKENGVYVEIFDTDYNVNSGLIPLPLFTGEKSEIIDNDHETYNKLKFKHSLPFPCNILNIAQRGISYGG